MGLFDIARAVMAAYDEPAVPAAYESTVENGPNMVTLDLDDGTDTAAYRAFRELDAVAWDERDYDAATNRVEGIVAPAHDHPAEQASRALSDIRAMNRGDIPDSWDVPGRDG